MEHRDFLEAILANPESDTARLVYADWLDENDFPERAEFIRLQCDLASRAKYDPERLPLVERQGKLLARHAQEWAKPLAAITRDYEFQRGFVAAVGIGGRKLLTHGEKLFQTAPVRHVKITRLGSSTVTVDDLVECAVLPRIRGLTLQGDLDPGDLRTLIEAPRLKKLTALTVDFWYRAEGVASVLDGCLPDLVKLDLGADSSILNSKHAETLARAPWTKKLKHLSLRNHAINVSGVEAIASSKYMKHLTHLDLYGCGAGLAGAKAIAASDNFKNLHTLDLRRNRLTERALRELTSSTKLPALRELYLGMNDLGPEAAEILVNWQGLDNLRFLHLYANPLGDDGLCALAASPRMSNLWFLDVTFTHESDRGLQALEKSTHLKKVRVGSFRDLQSDDSLLNFRDNK